jgi:UDP-N-acetylglucosamine 2-epimerase (non-hydrolysing)
LLREGLSPDRVINVGSPMREVIEYYSKNILESKSLSDLSLVSNSYIVVSAHREENIENQDNFSQFINMINKLAELYLMPVILSAHPRTMKKLQKSNIALHGMIRVMKPIGFTDYICLQKNSYIVLSDSGTITEESSIIGFDAINIRENFERPEGMEVGAVCLTGFDFDVINNCIQIIKGSINKRENVVDYLSNNVSEKIIKILYSYNNYVKKYIYHNK